MTPILLDTIVAIVIILSTITAFFRGFIKEMLTIVNLVCASAAAWFLSPLAEPKFREWLGITGEGPAPEKILGVVPPEIMAVFLSYAAIFFGVFVILSLAGMAISSSVKALGLGPIDRILGMGFGAARGFLIAFLFYLPFGFFMQPDQLPPWAKESVSVGALDSAYRWADDYLKNEEGEDTAEGEAEDEIDPDSLQGRLQKMAEDRIGKMQESSPETTEHVKDILTDDDKETP